MGALTATLGSVALVYGFISAAENGWASVGTLPSFAAAFLLFVIFVKTERRHKQPLLDLNILRDTSRLGGLVVMALIVGVHFAVLFMLVQYFQRILGYSPLVAGLAYMPLTATVFVISHFVPRLLTRFGARTLLAWGSVLVAASLAGLALLAEGDGYFPAVLIPLLVHAIGIALVFAPGTARHHAWRAGRACRRRLRIATNGPADRRRIGYRRHHLDLCICGCARRLRVRSGRSLRRWSRHRARRGWCRLAFGAWSTDGDPRQVVIGLKPNPDIHPRE
ncbi:MFS transporter (plasmid) [Agrobacterium rosae]|uniref:Uncharacterized protein n=1 Tax=Agrobacterium rosae TaxID=1972867 RepID=A0ABU4W4X6_9HYPH|nr:MFS transporter [Agrobacterium rosae]MDX8331815.1 hypothetical protein [Agrobacterium rosae]